MVLSLVLFAGQGFSQTTVVRSPDGRLALECQAGNSNSNLLQFTLRSNGNVITKDASLEIVANGSEASWQPKIMPSRFVREDWKPVYGERAKIRNQYRSFTIEYRSAGAEGRRLYVDARLYNEGVAFCYRLYQAGSSIRIAEERFSVPLRSNAVAWVSSTAQGMITQTAIGKIKEEAERPMTIRLNEQSWFAVGEAGLDDFARMKWRSHGDSVLQSKLSGDVASNDSLVGPWRYIMVAKSPAQLLQQNDFIPNLNKPCAITNTSWIKPGKVLREASLTTKGAYACIDFAARHDIRYICFDAGWYGREDADSSDATRVSVDPARSKGPLDLQSVIAYGKEKGIGVILYVNRRALERQMDTLFPLYESWGVKGIKFGFVQVGTQSFTAWLHLAIRKAAKYHLLVDIHDEYRPTGYARTYPNLLTQEGIRGDEESPYTEQSIKTLFTRMIAGPADNTICYYTRRVNTMGSHAAQLAKSLCIYSPLTFVYWYDRPQRNKMDTAEAVIRPLPETVWFDQLPMSWDDSKILEGDMEKFASIARKKNGDWFVGSLSGTEPRSFRLPLGFLDKGKSYEAVLYEDDPSAGSLSNVKITRKVVNAATVLKLHLEKRNGLAIHIRAR